MTERERESLQKIREKITEMKAREQAIVYRDKERERKARTRRLIQNGALAEKYLCGGKVSTPQELEEILRKLVSTDEVASLIKAYVRA